MFRCFVSQPTKFIASNCHCSRLISLSACASDSKKTHYEILGLTPRASQGEIRDAFFKLSKEIHPDTNPDDPDSHAKFVRLNEAYSVLSKLPTRRRYDLSLAYQLRARASSMSHTTGTSTSPGSGQQPFNDSHYQQSTNEFWDETIWEMRNRKKDANAFYPDNAYYGIKGIPRQSNGVVAAAVVLFLATGGGIYLFVALKYSEKKRRQDLQLVSARNARILKEVEEQARINGTAKQIQLLEERIAAAEAKRQSIISSILK